ncbi:MAG: histidine kinase [Roseivirga sp.]|nr:histidine kinase [Roseivirga sp.]
MEKQLTFRKYLKLEPYLHVLLWVFVLIYPYVKYIEREGGYPMSFAHELNALFFKMTISYFLYFWFFPKQKKKRDFLIAFLVFVINALLYESVDQLFHGGFSDVWNHLLAKSFTYASFGIGFFTVHSVKKSYIKQAEIDRLILEKQTAQLQTLKAKVNPHFLFNTLNMVYANALRKDDKTPELILKLSDGFRYVLNEGEKDYVSMAQELDHLNDYIHLQQERLSAKVNVQVDINIDDPKQLIPPLLLIGFIENAFKYTSVLKGTCHSIAIGITLNNSLLHFTCKNPFEERMTQSYDQDWNESGTGIRNTQERLDLLYPEQYNLEIRKANHLFEIELEIQL